MKNLGLLMSIACFAGAAGIAFGSHVERAVAAEAKTFDTFDYEACDWIVSEIERGPIDFKEITRTPGGNWCVTE